MSVAPHSRTLWLAGHFSACSLGSPAKAVGELQAHALNPPPRNALRTGRLPPALLLRPCRALTGRHGAGKVRSPGVPAQTLLARAGPRAPRCNPAPRFPKLAANTAASRDPHPQAANFVPSSEGAILAKFVWPSPLPTCAGDAPARAARAPGPPGAARSPGHTGESPPSPPPASLGGRAPPPPPR